MDGCGNSATCNQTITVTGCQGSRMSADNSSIERLIAYPNPASDLVKFKMMLTKDIDKVNLDVYDVSGNKIAQLYNGPVKGGQEYTVEFNASEVASGPYFYTLVTPFESKVGKLSILRR
jgi:hypothetical protein